MDFEDPWTYKRTSGAAPLKRKFGQITSLSHNQVALFGGGDDGVSVLTTGADGWTWDTASTDGQPAARKFHGQTGANGKLVVFGGAALSGEEMDDLATFTVEGTKGSWQTVEGVKPYRAMKSRHQVIRDEKEAAEEAAAEAAAAEKAAAEGDEPAPEAAEAKPEEAAPAEAEPPAAPETPPRRGRAPALEAIKSDEPTEDAAPAGPELDEDGNPVPPPSPSWTRTATRLSLRRNPSPSPSPSPSPRTRTSHLLARPPSARAPR